MIRTKLNLLGAAGLIAGVMLLGLAASNQTTSSVYAGSTPAPTNTPAPTATLDACQQQALDIQAAVVQVPPACTATPQTPQTAKTHTPTVTTTPAATNTPAATTTSAPATQAPAPSATRPGGGNEGVQVRPPNTGTGGGNASGVSTTWLIALGAMLVAVGGGSLLFGARRRS